MEYAVNLLQFIGAIILSAGYFPQFKQMIKTKSVGDFNFSYLLSVALGVGCMEFYAIYSLYKGVATMFFVTNTISFSFAVTMLIMYLIYKNKSKKGKTNE